MDGCPRGKCGRVAPAVWLAPAVLGAGLWGCAQGTSSSSVAVGGGAVPSMSGADAGATAPGSGPVQMGMDPVQAPGGDPTMTPGAGTDPSPPGPPQVATGCDMTGTWAARQYTDSLALGLGQRVSNYIYFVITQDGDSFTVTDSLRCGFEAPQGDALTTIRLGDATIQALAERPSSNGRLGTYAPNAEGGCDFSMEEVVNVYGCSDPYYAVNRFEPLPSGPATDSAPGTEDWDADGVQGITIETGGGNRYVVMRDWTSYVGATDRNVTEPFSVAVEWDSEEVVMPETPLTLRVGSSKDTAGEHLVWFKKVPSGTSGIPGTSPLDTCKNVAAFVADVGR